MPADPRRVCNKSGPEAKQAGTDPAEELAIRFLLSQDAAKQAAAYPGNLGAMEMFKFYREATPEEEKQMDRFLSLHKFREAWELLKKVTGVALHDPPWLKGARFNQVVKKAKSNAKVLEVPNTFHQVEVQPPQAKRKEFPFEGFIDFQGLKIDVENVKGSTRSGTGPEGDWSTFMFAHYGEIRGTEGTDGDKLDVYVGDNHDSSLVVVIHQHNPWDGQYDEDKVVLGCESVEEAIGLYKKQYDRPGFYKDGEYTAMPIGAFWRWVNEERNKGKKVKVAKKASLANDVIAALGGKWKDQIPGGLADKKPSDFDPKQIEMGIKVEMEHTKDRDMAEEIAMDHLTEIPDYYTRLKKMEDKAEGRDKAASMKWKHVTTLNATALNVAVQVAWVRIRSNGQMGQVVANRLPNGRWDVQFVDRKERYNPRNMRGKPKTDAEVIRLFREQGGSAPEVLIDSEGPKAPVAPTARPAPPAPKPAPKPAPAVSITEDEVTSALKRIVGDADYEGGGTWDCEPRHRQRLDHYVGSFDFRDEDEAWEEEYAGPLRSNVTKQLDQRFGRGLFSVNIDEKGFVNVYATDKGRKALGLPKQTHRWAMWKKGYAEGSPGALNAAKVVFSNLLAMLRAIQWNHLTSHWQIGGDSSYGDHLLFERLYKKTVEETDGLAEKLVGTFGIAAVDAREQAKLMAFTLHNMGDIGCPFERGLHFEQTLQVNLKECIEAMENIGQLSLGMDDFLRTMANDHETHIYLLQQRQGGVRMASATAGKNLAARRQRRAFMAKAILREAARTAGWWAIEPGEPGIHEPPGYEGGLLNAVPGRHADVMDSALDDIDLLYRQSWGRGNSERGNWKMAAKKYSPAPLTPEEHKLMGKANIWVMDWEMDGGTLPRNIQLLSDLRRPLKPAEARELLDWFYHTAPGNF